MKSHGESSAYIRRNSGTKSVGASSSFSGLRGKLCGCGEKVVLLQANTTKNKGRFFWRCRNWRSDDNCKYFEWVHDGEESVMEEKPEIEEEDDELVGVNDKYVIQLIRKNIKLKLKLEAEMTGGKIQFYIFVVAWILTLMFGVIMCLKSNCSVN
ncbi:hypothetical protein DEO72_LG8g2893 [Vigna unguiculata]|uniref:GRF-type domain-containing protein n=1 Tax=Vigna unguiculata TaxID=3917 RepID=A0A4D6MW58_VIGUN|nr:hypothetical protein DEO72_LG8g2893 [Vigna unguiculata]